MSGHPARKANIIKGLLAVVLGVVLISTIVPAAAQAKGPSVSIQRVKGQFVVSGHGFAANTKGSVWAQLGSLTAQKDVWTQSQGNFSVTFYTFTPDHKGTAQAKAWVKNDYAHTSATLNSSNAYGSGPDNSSTVALNSAKDGAPTTTTSTTAAPTTSTTVPAVGPTASAPVTTVPKTTATTSKGTTATTANPGTVSNTATAVAAGGTGYADSPGAGWTQTFGDDFTGTSIDKSKWGTYDGSGNSGIGTRSSAQDSVSNGEFDITGNGTVAGGVASNYKFTYGLAEYRVRMDANSVGYNDAIMLWPASENWPVDGEIDLQEMYNGVTNKMQSFAHWGSNNSQEGTSLSGDFSQWHTVSVDWEPGSVTYYLDGTKYWSVTGAAAPSTAHFLAFQLDVASESGSHASGSQLHVDWVKVYQKS